MRSVGTQELGADGGRLRCGRLRPQNADQPEASPPTSLSEGPRKDRVRQRKSPSQIEGLSRAVGTADLHLRGLESALDLVGRDVYEHVARLLLAIVPPIAFLLATTAARCTEPLMGVADECSRARLAGSIRLAR